MIALALSASSPPVRTSRKFAWLIEAGAHASIPATILLEEAFFARWIADYEAINARIETVLRLIAATSAALLSEHVASLQAIGAELRWRAGAELALAELARPVLSVAGDGVAVRSAAVNEDTGQRSFAGLYESQLGVERTGAAIATAALSVWKSYFAPGAIVDRLSAKRLTDGRRMSVMVQAMVPARTAGVVFTRDPRGGDGMRLEFVEGLGDALVSGERTAVSIGEAEAAASDRVAAEVFAVARRLTAHFGPDLDIEWAHDGSRVVVLQVRPITTVAGVETSTQAVFEQIDLFTASDAALAAFEPLPDFVSYFRQKRGPLFAFGRGFEGVSLGHARLYRLNRSAMQDKTVRKQISRTHGSGQVVLDFNDRIRQQVLSADALVATLASHAEGSDQVHRLLVREFIAGEFGFISRLTVDGGTLCEYSSEGLLALNRGTAAAETMLLGVDDHALFDQRQQRVVAQVTAAAQARFGQIQLEWVRSGDRLYLIDFSPVTDSVSTSAMASGGTVISMGSASGPVLTVNDADGIVDVSIGPAISLTGIADAEHVSVSLEPLMAALAQFSEPPIVVASRPYAALAPLLPHVAGFIFERGSLLCHLAILLRERRLPAIACAEHFQRAAGERRITIDAAPS